MKYALIKNVPLGSLLDRDKSTGMVNWRKYGFNPDDVRRTTVQGDDSEANYTSIIPISNQALFDSKLSELQAKIDTNKYENDSITVIEEAEKETRKTDVETIRAAQE